MLPGQMFKQNTNNKSKLQLAPLCINKHESYFISCACVCVCVSAAVFLLYLFFFFLMVVPQVKKKGKKSKSVIITLGPQWPRFFKTKEGGQVRTNSFLIIRPFVFL